MKFKLFTILWIIDNYLKVPMKKEEDDDEVYNLEG